MKRSFQELVELMKKLRGPDGCPWDRQQTLATLKPFIIEEAYEVVDAIDREDWADLREEIGDLLLQTVFASQVAAENDQFDIHDSVTAIHDKLVNRHPHVFQDVKADTADQVLQNWERMKSAERKKEEKSLMSGVPGSLPALLKASRLTEKAARVGFDWKTTGDIFEKIAEEVAELKEAVDHDDRSAIEDELGDLCFTIANIARHLKINPEEALQRANRKFQARFQWMESNIAGRSRSFDDFDLEGLDELWESAKKAT